MRKTHGEREFLSCDLRPGDVMFFRSNTAESAFIRGVSNPTHARDGWSHAALVLYPTIWFEAPGSTQSSGFYVRKPIGLVDVGRKYSVRLCDTSQKCTIFRRASVPDWHNRFWNAAIKNHMRRYPGPVGWAAAWASGVAGSVARRSLSFDDSIFCSQLVYATLVDMGLIIERPRLGEFISPTKLEQVLLKNGYSNTRQTKHYSELQDPVAVLAVKQIELLTNSTV